MKAVLRPIGHSLAAAFIWAPLNAGEAIIHAYLSLPSPRQLRLHLFTKHELTLWLRDTQALNRMLQEQLGRTERELREIRIQHRLTLDDLRAAWTELGMLTKDELSEFIDTAKRKSLVRGPVPTPQPPPAPEIVPASTP